MSVIDFRRLAPSKVRHINRPDPAPVIRCKPNVIRWHDTDTVSLEHLTIAEAERMFRLSLTDVHLYGLSFALGTMLGYDMESIA